MALQNPQSMVWRQPIARLDVEAAKSGLFEDLPATVRWSNWTSGPEISTPNVQFDPSRPDWSPASREVKRKCPSPAGEGHYHEG